jgi:hypothetical protein
MRILLLAAKYESDVLFCIPNGTKCILLGSDEVQEVVCPSDVIASRFLTQLMEEGSLEGLTDFEQRYFTVEEAKAAREVRVVVLAAK